MITVQPDAQGNLNFTQYGFDDDGDVLTVETVYLDAIDGVTTTAATRYPGWLQYSATQSELADGRRELQILFSSPSDQVELGKVYRIYVRVTDGENDPVFGTFTFTANQV